jgi:hypothetical protein
MTCPKCGFEQQGGVECLQCGIVFQKYRGASAPAPLHTAIGRNHTQNVSVTFPWNLFLRLTLLVSLGLFAISCLLKGNLPDGDEILEDLFQQPLQTAANVAPFQIQAGEMVYTITPLYNYELYGLVVSHHNCGTWWDIYHHGQWRDFINVKDLCVLWGSNVRTEVYKDMRFTSDSWTCTYYWPNQEVGARFNHACLSNNHLLSHDEAVTKALLDTETGDQIYLRGYLAEYSHSHGDFYRGTSTIRTDTGNGACETIYVEDYEILKRGNPFWRMAFSTSKHVILLSLLIIIVRFFRSSVTPRQG